MECVLFLARLCLRTGDAAAASALLQQLDTELSRRQLALPEGPAVQTRLLLDKAALHKAVGQHGAFAASLLPQFHALIDHAENNAAIVIAASKARGVRACVRAPPALGAARRCCAWRPRARTPRWQHLLLLPSASTPDLKPLHSAHTPMQRPPPPPPSPALHTRAHTHTHTHTHAGCRVW
jgi:hypothetical protein